MSEDIKDIKPPIDLPNDLMWLWITLVVIGVILLMTAIIIFIKRKKVKTDELPVAPSFTPWERAYARLQTLESNKLIERASLKAYYIELCDIVRRYLEERFNLKAPEMTTEEFLESLKSSIVLQDPQKLLLREFLNACDMVKFAKYESNKDEAKKSFEIVKQLIDQTHGI